MSVAVSKIKPELVLDKRLGFTSQNEFGVIKSGQTNSFKVLPTQNYSTSNITFNAQPPSPGIAISREIMVKMYWRVDFVGTAGALNGGTLLYPGLYDAPRSFPLAQFTQSIQATINNASVAQNNYQVINAFMRCNVSDDERRRDFSLTPSFLDQTQNYDDVYSNATTLGIANDPLQTLGQNSYEDPRGGWDLHGSGGTGTPITNPVVGVGNAATATVYFETTEPLLLSPFLSGSDNSTAFIGVQTLTLQLNLTNLARVWSHNGDNANAGTITSVTVSLAAAPELLLNFITPSPLQDIPLMNVYPYNTVDIYPQDLSVNVAPLASTTINSQNIQFNYIPRRIIVFVRRSDATSTFETSDTFFRINSVSINFDNISGVLSGANTQQLYTMSKNSGSNLSWSEWNTTVGSVLILDIGHGIMLQDATEAPSLTTTKQFQIQLNVTNLNTTKTVTPSLYICTIADGIITVENGTAILQNTILSREDILTASEESPKEWIKSSNWFGGGMVKKLNSFMKKTKNIGREDSGGAMIGGASIGGALIGGRGVSKSSLSKRLM